MIAAIIISLGLFAATPNIPATNVQPKQTAIVFEDQMSVYDIHLKKKGRK
jgi:hypothetical protein